MAVGCNSVHTDRGIVPIAENGMPGVQAAPVLK